MSKSTGEQAAASVESWRKFNEKVAEESAKTAFELGWKIVTKLANMAWEEVKVREALENYAARYNERHGHLKLFGAHNPIPLHQIYTEAEIVKAEFLSAFADQREMEESFKRGSRQHQAFRTERRDAVQVANETQFLNLLGAPGAGKSTFLRKLGQKALMGRTSGGRIWENLKAEAAYRHEKLPVMIELRKFRAEAIDLVGLITREFTTCGFPEAQTFVDGALKEGGLLILLDGLDEVPDARLTDVVEHLRDFVDRYGARGPDGNRFVTSCRTAHYRAYFRKFTDVVLADFSDGQIEQFARNRFRSEADIIDKTAANFLTTLHEPEHAGSLELARTPLLLGFLCVTFDYRKELPATRSKLYQRALDILLREWGASNRVHDEPAYKDLNSDLELDMLANLAEELFLHDRFFFTRDWAKGGIRKFMEECLSAPKSLDADQILTAVEVHQGLIVKRASDSYSFSHLTIQEYLTARRIWDQGEACRKRLIENHLFEARWHVVLELMAGFGEADRLLLTITDRCCSEAAKGSDNERRFLTWLEDCCPRQNEACSLDGAIAGAVARLKLFVFALTSGVARALDLTLDLDQDLERSRTRARARSLELARIDARDLAVALTRSIARDLAFGDSLANRLDRELALDRGLTRALDLARALDRELPLDRDRDRTEARTRARGLATTLERALALGHDRTITLSFALALARSGNHEFEPTLGCDQLSAEALTCLRELAQTDDSHLFERLSSLNSRMHVPNVRDGELSHLKRSIDGFILANRCKRAAYNVSATAWAQVCRNILFLRAGELPQEV